MHPTTIGLDLAKLVFQIHRVDAHGKVVTSKRLRRDAVLTFFANLPWHSPSHTVPATSAPSAICSPPASCGDRRRP